jgi:hypothetical protein
VDGGLQAAARLVDRVSMLHRERHERHSLTQPFLVSRASPLLQRRGRKVLAA